MIRSKVIWIFLYIKEINNSIFFDKITYNLLMNLNFSKIFFKVLRFI